MFANAIDDAMTARQGMNHKLSGNNGVPATKVNMLAIVPHIFVEYRELIANESKNSAMSIPLSRRSALRL